MKFNIGSCVASAFITVAVENSSHWKIVVRVKIRVRISARVKPLRLGLGLGLGLALGLGLRSGLALVTL